MFIFSLCWNASTVYNNQVLYFKQVSRIHVYEMILLILGCITIRTCYILLIIKHLKHVASIARFCDTLCVSY